MRHSLKPPKIYIRKKFSCCAIILCVFGVRPFSLSLPQSLSSCFYFPIFLRVSLRVIQLAYVYNKRALRCDRTFYGCEMDYTPTHPPIEIQTHTHMDLFWREK